MPLYKADFHIHTVLSPCGDLDMSPDEIVRLAKENGLDIIGITDHNTTKHGLLTKKYGTQAGIHVLTGVEVTTKEETHCLAFFEKEEQLNLFEQFLQDNLPNIPNDVEKFGYQVQIDEKGDIIYEEPIFLPSAINKNLEEVEEKVHALNGLFIPAHIDKPKNSIPSQLGFIPFDLNMDAVEISIHANKADYLAKNKYLQGKTFIQSSDSHLPDQIGTTYCYLQMETASFDEIRKALHQQEKRQVFMREEIE
ncbi:MAG: PHP domain-containing protein [Bacteroidales bacterium]|jgi:PHP family Zn ribbon phosphoesterase|nr:PHP domain-containing protein [Bacteroidales bacterium]